MWDLVGVVIWDLVGVVMWDLGGIQRSFITNFVSILHLSARNSDVLHQQASRDVQIRQPNASENSLFQGLSCPVQPLEGTTHADHGCCSQEVILAECSPSKRECFVEAFESFFKLCVCMACVYVYMNTCMYVHMYICMLLMYAYNEHSGMDFCMWACRSLLMLQRAGTCHMFIR